MMKNYDKIYDDWNEVKKNLSKAKRFIGLPLTTKLHNGTWYEPLVFKGREQSGKKIPP